MNIEGRQDGSKTISSQSYQTQFKGINNQYRQKWRKHRRYHQVQQTEAKTDQDTQM
jgi:hypothetical protein